MNQVSFDDVLKMAQMVSAKTAQSINLWEELKHELSPDAIAKIEALKADAAKCKTVADADKITNLGFEIAQEIARNASR